MVEIPNHKAVAGDPIIGVVTSKFLVKRLMLLLHGVVPIDLAPLLDLHERSHEPALLSTSLDHRRTFAGLCPVVSESQKVERRIYRGQVFFVALFVLPKQTNINSISRVDRFLQTHRHS